MRLFAILLALLFAVSGHAGTTATHPDFEFTLDVPDGWKHRFEGKTLWLAASGGYRVKIEAKDSPSPFNKSVVNSWYKSDGRSFQGKTKQFRVLKRPSAAQHFGPDHPSYLYAFGYEPGPGQAVGYVSSGSSKRSGNTLKVRALAYGKSTLVRGNRALLEAALGTFGWPSPPPEPGDQGPKKPGNAISTTDAGAAAVVATLPDSGDGSRTEAGSTSGSSSSGDGISSAGENYVPQGEFDRGSLKGGLGALANGGVSKKSARLRDRFKSRRAGLGAARTQAQKDKSAQYLGFRAK